MATPSSTTKASVLLLVLSMLSLCSASTPFIMLHGFSDHCGSSLMSKYLDLLQKNSGATGYCIEIGNGLMDSVFMPLPQQAVELCTKVKEMDQLKPGFNIVAFSQGNLLARSVIEFCDGAPPVKNYVSLGGPQAGTATLPACGLLPSLMCQFMNTIIKAGVYSDYCQEHLSASGYLKLPHDIPTYLEKSRFLPKLNNEIPGNRNSTYKERFSSLQNLVLIMFEQDIVVVPKKSAWFGFYAAGSLTTILPVQLTKLYTEDWIGLRKLDEAGKVQFISVAGMHLFISDADAKKYVVPYLIDGKRARESTKKSDSFIRSEELPAGSVAAI